MLKPYGQELAQLDGELVSAAIVAHHLISEKGDDAIQKDADTIALIDGYLAEAERLSSELNLRSTYDLVCSVRADRPFWVGRSFIFSLKDIRSRLEGDLKHVNFYLVPLSKFEYYDKPYFAEKIETRFKDAFDDMREAGNCFALGRWTGVVHHCMAIVQTGILELGKDLNCSLDEYLHDWNEMLTALENAIGVKREAILGGSKRKAANADRSKWNKLEPFYAEVLSDVRDMKNAWRNPGFHFRLPPFDEPKAKKVLDKVRDFMTNLADNI